jgi:NAD(P)-dependent dehydrogenase (short-subunit alcohol dehydrogenase family)
MTRLAGKTALVIGAGHPLNMGAEIARRYAREGARVVVAGRKTAPLEVLSQEIGGDHILVDVTDEGQLGAAAVTLRARYQQIDIIANTVGVHHHTHLASATAEGIDLLLRAHIYGPIFIFKHLAALLSDGGAVILVSSCTAEPHSNPPRVGVYAASKAATNRLVQSAAVEYGTRGIRVNSIAPGLVLTPMGDLSADITQRLLKRTPLGRLATVADIAAAAVFLASDECFMTGEVLQVNGGFRMFDVGLTADDPSYSSSVRGE